MTSRGWNAVIGFGLLVGLGGALSACGEGGGDDTPTPIGESDGGGGSGGVPDMAPPIDRPACANGRDDDGDGQADHPSDPGCADSQDEDESDDPPVTPAACANRVDDDDDGTIDLMDRGCAGAWDDDESDDPPAPACGNGSDDDTDGYTDYPADPGCGSLLDGDETDSGPSLPECADGTDNDRDGLPDLADPGCTGVADPREETLPETPIPACADGEDNDGDGIVDFPNEPGCSAAGDDDEANPAMPPDCADGRDNDSDGSTDYPDDPGCQGVGDKDETDPRNAPACHDAVDNDRDGATDYPDDRGCQAAADGSEAGSCGVNYDPVDIGPDMTIQGDTRGGRFGEEGSCGGRGAAELVYGYRVARTLEALIITTTTPEGAEGAVETTLHVRRACLDPDTEVACVREPLDGVAENTLRIDRPEPGEYSLFVDGANGIGGPFALTVTEIALAQCLNRVDDDADGRVDYPSDPGCAAAADRDETDEGITGCANDLDDDGDSLIDYPLDLGCESAADQDEVDVCGQGVRVVDYPIGEAFLLGDTTGGTSQFQGSCVPGNGAEQVIRYRNPFNARLLFSLDFPETQDNTGLYIRAECSDPRSELSNGCSLGIPGISARGRVRIDRAAAGDYYLVVDHTFGPGGPFKLAVMVDRLPAGCADGADGDADGHIDGDDRGCEGPLDEDERDPADGTPLPVCDNGLDDDGDGATDHPFDVGCAAKGDINEDDPPEDMLPECGNSLDDDGDGRADFPEDPGCQARGDGTERNPVPPPQCADGVDQDRDGRVDYPFDPGCDAAGDPSEDDPDRAAVCSNSADDDRDGLVDFPFDLGCAAAADGDETDPAVAPTCGNRLDDDEDGRTDYPMDPGCRFRADPDEADPNFPPACANGRDDDADGRSDYPDDIGCQAAFDSDEVNDGRALERCRDGADNDGDMLIDLADPGCSLGRDNDEGDIGPTACNNGEDDDADGLVDWPDDDGCAAQGGACEQPGYGLCDGVCVDLASSAENCGRCGRICDAEVACIEGACGGLYTFEGVGRDVAEADLDGWSQCHSDNYSGNTPIANFLAACNGEFVMYGCRALGSPTFSLVAMGERDVVFADTGDGGNNVNTTHGVSFYFSQSFSIGFVPQGELPSRNSCDTGAGQGDLRMCWHTGRGQLNAGYRCGNEYPNANWERVIFTSR